LFRPKAGSRGVGLPPQYVDLECAGVGVNHSIFFYPGPGVNVKLDPPVQIGVGRGAELYNQVGNPRDILLFYGIQVIVGNKQQVRLNGRSQGGQDQIDGGN